VPLPRNRDVLLGRVGLDGGLAVAEQIVMNALNRGDQFFR
jgi:hypothetical protein